MCIDQLAMLPRVIDIMGVLFTGSSVFVTALHIIIVEQRFDIRKKTSAQRFSITTNINALKHRGVKVVVVFVYNL